MTFDNEQDKKMVLYVLANHQLDGPYLKVSQVVKALDALTLKVERAKVVSVDNIAPLDIKNGGKK